MRLITKDGNIVTNARVVGRLSDGRYAVLSDCFNLVYLQEEVLWQIYSRPVADLEAESMGLKAHPDVDIEFFVSQIKSNIERFEEWLRVFGDDLEKL